MGADACDVVVFELLGQALADVKKDDEHGLVEAKTLSRAQGREREVRIEGGLERTEEEGREKAGWSEVGP